MQRSRRTDSPAGRAPAGRTVRTAAALLISGLVAVGAVAGSAAPPPARAASSGQLRQRISSGRSRVTDLAGQVAAANRQLDRLNAAVSAASSRLSAVRADLARKRTQLLALQSRLATARAHLGRLEATEARDQRVLASQLVGSYEAGRPNLVTVVLEASGFKDLLERLSFAQRISHHDASIIANVKAARRAVAAQAVRLGALSQRQQRLTEQVVAERNRVAALRAGLLSQRLAAARARSAKAGQLASARADVASLHSRLVKLQAAQRAAARASASSGAGSGTGSGSGSGSASGSGSGSGGSAGGSGAGAPASAPSSGGFEFPMPKADVSPPATWSPDQGVDISAPGGTPELAVCSGTIVLHGIGGFGPSAPVLHCDSPIDGYSYVYYGHAGPGNWVGIGTHVSQGQVISEVGYGIVGISTGPHLEIGFADSSGSPIGSQTAGTMMSLLLAAYNA